MSEQRNIRISGSGVISGGRYGTVHISGSGKCMEALEAESVHISGSGRFQNVSAGSIHISGSASFDGQVIAKQLRVSGSVRLSQPTESDEMHVSGSIEASSALRGVSGCVSGSIRADDGAEVEEMQISGSAHISGLLNAERLTIKLNGRSKIDEIGGNDIQVFPAHEIQGGILRFLFGSVNPHKLACKSIEGTNVNVENTDCEMIRANTVRIGPGCQIGAVEYADSVEIDESSKVITQKRV